MNSWRRASGTVPALFWTLILFILACSILSAAADQTVSSLELSRPVRTWEFLPVVGSRAAMFGNEAGQMEGWVYPLKIFRGLHLTFHANGRALPAETLVRTIIVHPESATLVYADDNFSVRETFFVPVHESGGVVLFDVETAQPLEIEASFIADFQLQWPAALGGTYLNWEASQHAFVLGEEQKKFAAFVGSPTATAAHVAYQTNYSSSEENSLKLGVTNKGREHKILVFAASTEGFADAQSSYQRISASYENLLRDSAQYYRDYLARTVTLSLPDPQLQQAYDWARVSTIQGLVDNPFFGTGLIAGYRTSGLSQRPGFAWFFGRDSLWTTLALNSIGDFKTSRVALEFISKFQRADGKVPHEISQAANFVQWFEKYPYGYASADATPLFIIAVNDYVVRSHDLDFARDKWDSLWKAYQFLRSTYDAQNFPQNFGFGHGWVEGGPLLPVKSEVYQSGLGLEALHSLANLAALLGKADVSRELTASFDQQKPAFNSTFWSPEKKSFIFALDQQSRRVDEITVLSTVPMWFGVTDADKSESTLQQLAGADHQADWGMRILSNRSPIYGGAGYHFGSVWPLFTGWASVAEYRYHQPFSGYSNLRANSLLAFDGSLGHVTEVLSGDFYQPLSTSSPHQIWSAAMVISPMLRGMLGLDQDLLASVLKFAPHLPANWDSFAINNLTCGSSLNMTYRRSVGAIVLNLSRAGEGNCRLEFSPEVSARTQVISVDLDGRKIPFQLARSSTDQHVMVNFPVPLGNSALRIQLKNDFDLSFSSVLPPLGSSSEGLRVLSETWNASHTQLDLAVEGVPGRRYSLSVRNPSQIASIRGGTLTNVNSRQSDLEVVFPASNSEIYVHQEIILNFSGSR